MVAGKTPWIDQKVNDKETSRNEINSNFMDLSYETKYNLFEEARFPKSNIVLAAKLLTKLKNRTNRFPSLKRTEFSANEHAVKVIATEYNMGGTDSKAKAASLMHKNQ